MPSAKLGIILQTLFIFLINLRFPHPSLLTSLLMGYIRSLQPDAVVRAFAVIEVDKSSYMFLSLLICLKAPILAIHALSLDDTVHALCKGIVGGFVVLRHRDLYAILLQFLHIQVAAVLDATVRVVDESREITSTSLFYGHAEGF